MQLLTRILKERWLLFIGLATLAVGLPLSRALVSIGPGILLGAWVFDTLYHKDFKEKWSVLLRNRTAILFATIFLVYLFGVGWSSNGSEAWKIVLNKTPLLFAVLIFGSWRPITKSELSLVLLLHVAAVVLSTLLSFVHLQGMPAGVDPREAMLFVNHIRLSLMIVLAMVSMAYLAVERPSWVKGVGICIGIWFLYFMASFQMATGIGIFLFLLLSAAVMLIRHAGYRRWLGWAAILCVGFSSGYVVMLAFEQFHKPSTDEVDRSERTSLGTPYTFDMENDQLENGHYVWHYLARDEMREAWNKRATERIDPHDEKEVLLTQGRLIRYLTSKGLRKDAAGVNALTLEDIARIEAGDPTVEYAGYGSVRKRLYMLLYEIDAYRNVGDPSLSSLTIKWEYWRTGWQVIQDHIWTGVGTGDVRDTFEAYQASEGRISPDAYDKAHNQYITWLATFGIFGGSFVMIAFVLPLFIRTDVTVTIWMIYGVFLISFLTEDTFENQLGLNLILFYALLFLLPSKELESTSL